ncbi:transcription termination/antitermination protein NusG [Candidatus Phytoplasma fraxini]|uniref:Transcription termination/antitermination protein NusG n=1 Tax=Ash yellows phytoplasma TaxID=35780 RepID=A0ABZ2UA22_ASHYP
MKKKEYINHKESLDETLQSNIEPKWYIIQTYSGYENSVKEDLLKLVNSSGSQMSHLIFEVICPKEKYVKIKADGTKQEKERKMFSGYVFIKMILNDYSWFIVNNLPKVTNFLGSSKGSNSMPVPLHDSEINPILIKTGFIEKPSYDHLINKKVEIINGSFAGKRGLVSFIDDTKNLMIVEIDLFGRNTPIEISLSSFKEIM